MDQFNYNIPVKVLFGAGRLRELHQEDLPGKKALIVTSAGRSVKRYGYLAALETELDMSGIPYELFDEVRANPTEKNVMDGAELARDNGCDFVVGLGGGSVLDCAKCIALMITNPGTLWDYSLSEAGGKRQPEREAAPLVAIPTSAGTGSEVDIAAVISKDEVCEKTAFLHISMFPKIAVVDPELTVSVPPKYTAYQGMDTFFHAAETMINRGLHPMAEMFALRAIGLVAEYLPRAVQDGCDIEARTYMSLASMLAGCYMLCTSGHRMEHVLGSYHPDLVHGAGLIVIAHAYYDHIAERKAAEVSMIKMAGVMGVSHPTDGKDFVKALDHLVATVGCDELKLSDFGVTKDEMKKYPAKIHRVLGGNINNDPIAISDADYLDIYEKAYR